MNSKMLGTLTVLILFTFSCNKETTPAAPEVSAEAAAPAQAVTETKTEVHTEAPVAAANEVDVEKGKRLYLSNCISCHNKDPNKKGSIGPEMVDAPLEVMTAKVMTGRYPEVLPAGFVPKRKSKAMLKIVKLEKDIPSIHAWVQSQKK